MQAIFYELPPFAKVREQYLDDAAYRALQIVLLQNPEAGDLIKGSGGLRKLRYVDALRGKGKRGGLRVIYYWLAGQRQIWLFTIYGKHEADDLTAQELKILRRRLEFEIEARSGENGKA